MSSDASASPPNEQQIGFHIADLAERCPCVGPILFRFVNERTLATTGSQHSAFVKSALSFLRGEEAAFAAHEISFAGVPPTVRQLTEFARHLAKDAKARTPRPTIGRYWTGIEIPEVGTFDGVSFWLSFHDLTRVSWAPATAVEILGLHNPVYVESIDQCAPELHRAMPAESPLRSAVDPSLTTADILNLLVRAMAPDPKLSRRQWEIVSECRSWAYDLARIEAETHGLPIDTCWRWNSEFNRLVVRRRADWVKGS